MAETEQKIRAQRGKITLGMLGNPAGIKTMDPAAKALAKGRYMLGTIYGQVSGFIERADAKGEETFEGLKGAFIAVPADANGEDLESGVLFMPDAFHNLIAEQYRKLIENDPKARLEFALEVSTVDAKNPAGYSWEVTPATPFVGAHPLDNIMQRAAQVTAEKRKALAGPKK